MDCSSSASSSNNSSGDEAFGCGICLDLIYKPVVLACGHISRFRGRKNSWLLFTLVCRTSVLRKPSCWDINKFPENELYLGACKQVSITDVVCAGCKELLFRPAVLNCGHVYCESYMSAQVNIPLKCQVCHCTHTGDFPKVCLDLDHFLEEQFPKEYSARHENVHNRTSQSERGDSSFCTIRSQEQKTKSSSLCAKDESLYFQEDLSNSHVGVGCDLCGMYPIIGKRYRCKDCKEKVGFDVCGACYHTSSKLPGRFNQQHTPDHRLELDDSRLLSKILIHRNLQPESSFQSEVGEEKDEDVSESVTENEAGSEIVTQV